MARGGLGGSVGGRGAEAGRMRAGVEALEATLEGIQLALLAHDGRQVAEGVRREVELLGDELKQAVLCLAAEALLVPVACVAFVVVCDRKVGVELLGRVAGARVEVDVLKQLFVAADDGQVEVVAQNGEVGDEGGEGVDGEGGEGAAAVVAVEVEGLFEIVLHVF